MPYENNVITLSLITGVTAGVLAFVKNNSG